MRVAEIEIEVTQGKIHSKMSGDNFAVMDALVIALAECGDRYRRPGVTDEEIADTARVGVLEALKMRRIQCELKTKSKC